MRNWFFKQRPVPAPIRRNIESITQLEQAFDQQRTTVDVISDTVTRFTGSIRFILAHALVFTGWILLNTVLPEADRFDPYPFGFLGLVVSLEAIFLSTFVLMSQNRQNRMADQWAHVDLQVSLLAEQETTKMLQRIYHILGLENEARLDKELKDLAEATQVERLVEELAKAREPEKPDTPPAAATPPF